MNLAPVPSPNASCESCGAALVSDQRYCLACGHPVSPVRLAFLDVLQNEQRAAAGPYGAIASYSHVEPSPLPGPLRRYAPLFAVLSTLLLAMVIGLLIGHWVSQSNKPSGTQTVKIEGLAAAAPAAATGTASASRASSAAAASKQAKEEAEEAKAEKAEHVAPPPKPVKVSATTLKNIGSSTGKKHEEEVHKLGSAPIETGGGSGSAPAPSSSESNKPIGAGSKVESIE